VVVDGDGEGLLRPRLAHDILAQVLEDPLRRRDIASHGGRVPADSLLIDDLVAELHTLYADVHPRRSGDQPGYLFPVFAAE